MKKCFVVLFLLLFNLANSRLIFAQNFPSGFNFVLPGNDTTVSSFLPKFNNPIITNSQRVTVVGNKFYSGGQPIRFWGGNLTVQSNFPEYADASAWAKRMKKMGINIMRFHHLDNNWGGNSGSIFVDNQTTRQLNSTTLDKMENFISELKKNGVYVNMNLNVSRTFNQFDGVPNYNEFEDFAKGLTIIDTQLIRLQKEYAAQIFNHINPYTGMRLGVDPVLAVVEMINENSLYGMWRDDHLRLKSEGGKLQQRHVDFLNLRWNEYLTAKYSTQSNLQNAWASTTPPTPQIILGGNYEGGTIHANWQNELHNGAAATFALDNTTAHSGTQSLKANITNGGSANWNIQWKQVNLSLEKDSVYIISFWAKGNNNQNISIGLSKNTANYDWYGGANYTLTNNWKEYRFVFTAPTTILNDVRLSFSLGSTTGEIWLDDVSMQKRYVKNFLPGEDLTLGNIARINYVERLSFVPQRFADMAGFIIKLQKDFMEDFRNYLVTDLGITAPITGTNALSGIQEASAHANLDFSDDHNYWDHPNFPAGWSTVDWTINNTSSLKNNAVPSMTGLFSGVQLNDKPFTMSEYNHAFPNRFRTEMVPLVAAYGSFHGLDGLMFFEYNGEPSWNVDHVANFLTLNRDHSVMSLFPSCAAAYRMGYITEGTPILINYSKQDIEGYTQIDNNNRWNRFIPYDKRLLLEHNIKTGTYSSASNVNLSTLPIVPNTGLYTTTTNEISVNTNTGIFKVNTPKFKAISGFLNESSNHDVGELKIISSSGYGTVTWVTNNPNKNLVDADSSLLTISTKLQNTGQIWNGTNTSTNGNWGTAPTLIEPINLQLELKSDANFLILYKLDGKGNIVSYQVVNPSSSFTAAVKTFSININTAADQTLWYGVKRSSNILALNDFLLRVRNITSTSAFLHWQFAKDDIVKQYEIQKSSDGRIYRALIQQKNSSFTDAQQSNSGNKVFYRVKAILHDGNVFYSNIYVYDRTGKESVLIYPNPTNGVLNITNDSRGDNAVIVTNDGAIIKAITIVGGYNSIDISIIPSGNYQLLIYKANELVKQLKFIKK